MSLRCARRRRPGCRVPSPVPSGCQSWIRLEQRPAREATTRALQLPLYTTLTSSETLKKPRTCCLDSYASLYPNVAGAAYEDTLPLPHRFLNCIDPAILGAAVIAADAKRFR